MQRIQMLFTLALQKVWRGSDKICNLFIVFNNIFSVDSHFQIIVKFLLILPPTVLICLSHSFTYF